MGKERWHGGTLLCKEQDNKATGSQLSSTDCAGSLS